ncbi:alpha/beta hydrolase family esterase [Patescibacteria group bacterium]
MIKNFFISILILILLGLSVFVGLRMHNSKEKVLEFNGKERRYRVHLPKDFNTNEEYPVVLALHGLSFGARVMELETGFSRLADKNDFIVVYAYGSRPNVFIPLSWNSEFCCAYGYKEGIDDVGFVASLINELRTEYKVEKNKVFLTGHSNGGMLASYVALKHPDKVRAIAVVSSAVGGRLKKEDDITMLEKSYSPIPTMIINGKDDLAVPFDGGAPGDIDLYSFTSVYDAVNLWLENNECTKHPAEISNQDNFSKEIYNECKDGADVVLVAYHGGHNWPGGAQDIFRSISRKNINASQLIWEFFESH